MAHTDNADDDSVYRLPSRDPLCDDLEPKITMEDRLTVDQMGRMLLRALGGDIETYRHLDGSYSHESRLREENPDFPYDLDADALSSD